MTRLSIDRVCSVFRDPQVVGMPSFEVLEGEPWGLPASCRRGFTFVEVAAQARATGVGEMLYY